MSELERYTPPEVKQEANPDKAGDAGLRPETIRKIQEGYSGKTGEPDAIRNTPERVELHKNRESLAEKEPGTQYKPGYSDDQAGAQGQNPVSDNQVSDDQTDTRPADARDES